MKDTPPTGVTAPYTALGAFGLAAAAGVGLLVGSFLNVVVHRLPRGESIVRPGSRCPSCGAPVRFFDNIPVFSWLLLGGRCQVVEQLPEAKAETYVNFKF